MYRTFCIALMFLAACSSGPRTAGKAKAIREIIQAEQNFEKMAAEQGLAAAFAFFADSAAVVNRGEKVIHGRDSIRIIYSNPRYRQVKLSWKPDFVEVSGSLDLGYTYGKYTFTRQDSTGHSTTAQGIFHTVWKKQANGEWKYVWD